MTAKVWGRVLCTTRDLYDKMIAYSVLGRGERRASTRSKAWWNKWIAGRHIMNGKFLREIFLEAGGV